MEPIDAIVSIVPAGHPELLATLRNLALPSGDVREPLGPDVCAELRRHRLGPLAYAHGQRQLRAEYAASALLARRRAAVADRAISALRNVGIPVIVLKGMSYAHLLYASPGERPMTDVDVLVPTFAMRRAVEALERRAFSACRSTPFHHGRTLVWDDVCVDLHRDIQVWTGPRVPMDEVWHRAVPALERADGAFRLDPVDELIFHAIHLGRTQLVAPLIAYIDAARLLTRIGDATDVLMRRAKRFRAARVVDATLAATRQLTGVGNVTSATQQHRTPGCPSIDALVRARPVSVLRRIRRRVELSDDWVAAGEAAVGYAVRKSISATRALRARS